MLTLALDTTTRAGSVAVVRGAATLAVVYGDATRTHGERLPAEFDRALTEAGVAAEDLELLAVASGPGAFTGLRIGLAAIQGLAMVLNVQVVAVSALDALALAVLDPLPRTIRAGETSPQLEEQFPRRAAGAGMPERSSRPLPAVTVAAWMDAQRGEVFAASYHAPADPNVPTPISDPVVAPPDAVLASLLPAGDVVFVGDGAVRYRAQILQDDGARHRVAETPAPLAPLVARIGIARAARGEAGPPHALQPLYVRRPDAELERQRRRNP